MATVDNTAIEDKSTPTYVAAEIYGAKKGYEILHMLIHDLGSADRIDDEWLNRALWLSDVVLAELEQASTHAEETAYIHRHGAV
jgi:hypothetical protein